VTISCIELRTVVQARQGNPIAEIQGETVVLHLASGEYFGLNEVGTRIWKLIQTPLTVDAVVIQLEREYESRRDILEADVVRLITELQDAGLVAQIES